MEPCPASWQVHLSWPQGQAPLALLATCLYHLVSSPYGAFMAPLQSLEHIKGKSPGGRYVLREPLGLRVGDLWESWSCAPPCLELLPPSLQTLYTDRTFKQTPGTVLSLKVPWCHP